ncbi:MAG: hypothetical protein IJ744_05495 [Lachnospiraceae bacterium]|nr:hypothetical protein [Lachnospiraceae bacterium]
MEKGKKHRSWIVLFLVVCVLTVLVLWGMKAFHSQAKAEVAVGDTLVFGHFEQDENAGNGPEEIVWRVLAKSEDGERALVISEQALERRVYQEGYIAANWEDCTLRMWLNEAFYADAFTEKEREAIAATKIEPEAIEGTDVDPGNATEDHVFLLSIAEADVYFSSAEDRICTPTAHALAQGAYSYKGSNACWWWLRTPGSDCNVAARVVGDGSIIASGCVNEELYCVRPAMWISLEAVGAK